MKKLVKFAVDYPVSITMMILAILLLGKISYDRLGVDLLPSLESSKLYVELETVENPPVEVESKFVEDIEAVAIRTNNAQSITSVIRESGALITVEYQWGSDMGEAFMDLQRAVAAFSQNREINQISVTQRDPSADPIMLLALSNPEMGAVELTRIAESYIRPTLLSVQGIADVEFEGERAHEVIVQTDPYKLEAYSLTVASIAQSIQDNNYRTSGGRIQEKGLRYIVSGENTLRSIEQFNTIIVGYRDRATQSLNEGASTSESAEGDGGIKGAIYLSQVAEVFVSPEELQSEVRHDGKMGLGIEIFKERDFNTLKATQEIISKLPSLRAALAGYELVVVNNQGEFIEGSIGAVQESALLGMALAVLVLFVFLRRFGTTLVVSLAIPISIVATFNMFYFGGLTLNIMTLGGLALGAGMLVDNAIVVIESIFRKTQEGFSVRDAIIDGTSEVGSAIIASTLTTIVVFLPIVYLQGEIGSLFKDQAWSVTFALLSSLFVAILAIPVMYKRFLGGKKQEAKQAQQKQSAKSIEIRGYGRWLRGVLRHRFVVVVIAAGFVGGVFMMAGSLGSEFMPSTNSGAIKIDLQLSQGSSIETTSSTVASLEDIIMQLSGDTTTTIYSQVGVAGADGGTTPLPNQATLMVHLGANTAINTENLQEQLQEYLSASGDIEAIFSDAQGSISSLLEQSDGDILVDISGDELQQLQTLSDVLVEELGTLQSVGSLSFSQRSNDSEIVISIDRIAASLYGVSMQDIINQVRNLLQGTEAGEMTLSGEINNIRVALPKVPVSQLRATPITIGERNILLGELAQIKSVPASSEILRRGQNRTMEIAITSKEDVPLSELSEDVREVIASLEVPQDYRVSIEGSELKREESMNGLLFALALSIILVYMVMASQFESLLHPFTILLTIPLAVAGALLLFILTGKSLNIMAAIGIVMLVGIAVNSSILLVDRIGQLLGEGLSLVEAIVSAAQQRIRPILMTSATTILALLPMALSMGENSDFQSSMAIAVIGGLVASTALSLIVIPCVYHILESMKRTIVGQKK